MYLFLKFLHIAAVVIFLGNILTGLFWHAHAARTKDPRLLAHTMAGVIRSDRLFTIPGVIVIAGAGVGLALYGGFPIISTGWILWTLILFAISGLIFQFRVAPLQQQLRAYADAAAGSGAFDFAHYRGLALRWELWGAAALATPFAGLALMVLKPSL